MIQLMDDETYMRIAIARAKESAANDEVPVGAAIIGANGEVLATAGNEICCNNDPAGHAEIIALRMAAQKTNNYRLPGTTVYVTLEPCAMCASAMIHARIERLVFGARDPKTGAVVSRYEIGRDGLLNHIFDVTEGVLEEECSQLLKEFFQKALKLAPLR